MRSTLPFIVCVLLLQSCASADGGRGGNAGNVTGTQTISNSVISGNVSQQIGSSTGGSGGPGGTATNSVPINLALDPAAFASLFGSVPKITEPTTSQLSKVSEFAQRIGDTTLQAQATQCLNLSRACTIGIRP